MEDPLVRIAIACDHRGYEAKRRLMPHICKAPHEIIDYGCESGGSVDYPDYAILVAQAVAEGRADVGILMDGSGIGMTIAANKVCGVRAALVHDEVTARRSREHNHCNVLCMGCDLLSEDQMRRIVMMFLQTEFVGGRHARRVSKIRELDAERALLCKAADAVEEAADLPVSNVE